jgi:RNA polymerase sigma factor (sigma-70 family)
MRAEVETTRIEGGVLSELYERHAGEALRLAYLQSGDASLAEDLVQDAFVRPTERLLHLCNPGGFHAYLRTTIGNLTRSHFRRRTIERRFIERQGEPRPVDAPELSDRDRMRRALMELPLRQRTAIVLRYFEDLSEAQAADMMH